MESYGGEFGIPVAPSGGVLDPIYDGEFGIPDASLGSEVLWWRIWDTSGPFRGGVWDSNLGSLMPLQVYSGVWDSNLGSYGGEFGIPFPCRCPYGSGVWDS